MPSVSRNDVSNNDVLNDVRSPVILLPGLAGSRMLAKLDRHKVAHWYCSKKSDWYRIWLDVKLILPLAINCFVDNFRCVLLIFFA